MTTLGRCGVGFEPDVMFSMSPLGTFLPPRQITDVGAIGVTTNIRPERLKRRG